MTESLIICPLCGCYIEAFEINSNEFKCTMCDAEYIRINGRWWKKEDWIDFVSEEL